MSRTIEGGARLRGRVADAVRNSPTRKVRKERDAIRAMRRYVRHQNPSALRQRTPDELRLEEIQLQIRRNFQQLMAGGGGARKLAKTLRIPEAALGNYLKQQNSRLTQEASNLIVTLNSRAISKGSEPLLESHQYVTHWGRLRLMTRGGDLKKPMSGREARIRAKYGMSPRELKREFQKLVYVSPVKAVNNASGDLARAGARAGLKVSDRVYDGHLVNKEARRRARLTARRVRVEQQKGGKTPVQIVAEKERAGQPVLPQERRAATVHSVAQEIHTGHLRRVFTGMSLEDQNVVRIASEKERERILIQGGTPPDNGWAYPKGQSPHKGETDTPGDDKTDPGSPNPTGPRNDSPPRSPGSGAAGPDRSEETSRPNPGTPHQSSPGRREPDGLSRPSRATSAPDARGGRNSRIVENSEPPKRNRPTAPTPAARPEGSPSDTIGRESPAAPVSPPVAASQTPDGPSSSARNALPGGGSSQEGTGVETSHRVEHAIDDARRARKNRPAPSGGKTSPKVTPTGK